LGERKIGAPPKFNRKKLSRGINKLQEIASETLTHGFARKEFEKNTKKRKSYKIRGHGRNRKRENIENWFERYIPYRNCVYIFWSHKKCLYVGRTGAGGGRPSSHFQKHWFDSATRIVVIATSRSQTSKIECLAIHRYLPKFNVNKASSKKWTKKCPLCRVHKNIESELRTIFRFKKS
jgi:hypothetical protein